VETELIIACRPGYLPKAVFDKLVLALDEIGRLISGLRNYLKNKPENK
jgi:hypothetical protein